MSVYIHKDVRSKVKVRLFEAGGEFSGLVESLLRDWLAKQKCCKWFGLDRRETGQNEQWIREIEH
jgi:hypothetical protein